MKREREGRKEGWKKERKEKATTNKRPLWDY